MAVWHKRLIDRLKFKDIGGIGKRFLQKQTD